MAAAARVGAAAGPDVDSDTWTAFRSAVPGLPASWGAFAAQEEVREGPTAAEKQFGLGAWLVWLRRAPGLAAIARSATNRSVRSWLSNWAAALDSAADADARSLLIAGWLLARQIGRAEVDQSLQSLAAAIWTDEDFLAALASGGGQTAGLSAERARIKLFLTVLGAVDARTVDAHRAGADAMAPSTGPGARPSSRGSEASVGAGMSAGTEDTDSVRGVLALDGGPRHAGRPPSPDKAGSGGSRVEPSARPRDRMALVGAAVDLSFRAQSSRVAAWGAAGVHPDTLLVATMVPFVPEGAATARVPGAAAAAAVIRASVASTRAPPCDMSVLLRAAAASIRRLVVADGRRAPGHVLAMASSVAEAVAARAERCADERMRWELHLGEEADSQAVMNLHDAMVLQESLPGMRAVAAAFFHEGDALGYMALMCAILVWGGAVECRDPAVRGALEGLGLSVSLSLPWGPLGSYSREGISLARSARLEALLARMPSRLAGAARPAGVSRGPGRAPPAHPSQHGWTGEAETRPRERRARSPGDGTRGPNITAAMKRSVGLSPMEASAALTGDPEAVFWMVVAKAAPKRRLGVLQRCVRDAGGDSRPAAMWARLRDEGACTASSLDEVLNGLPKQRRQSFGGPL